ncbi:hypothetical protein SCHPADRAFT_436051 [Schizopora paradoxa]|uniref:Uncharacterized protein n=1 Tax=Schizopora paradoxa TaxID=27342 RepID=A0A0H2RRM9_9AGAM|nr:hypothetical protein SCHPADRAFT_436051 [Schizopora paradoxa]
MVGICVDAATEVRRSFFSILRPLLLLRCSPYPFTSMSFSHTSLTPPSHARPLLARHVDQTRERRDRIPAQRTQNAACSYHLGVSTGNVALSRRASSVG